jgi:hypothetical protein
MVCTSECSDSAARSTACSSNSRYEEAKEGKACSCFQGYVDCSEPGLDQRRHSPSHVSSEQGIQQQNQRFLHDVMVEALEEEEDGFVLDFTSVH